MRFSFVVTILTFATLALSWTVKYTASYDPVYDDGDKSLRTVACSNGVHGLITAGYKTFKSLHTFPYIGGAPQITGWNSRYCGTCWELTYTDTHGHHHSVNITAIDTGDKHEEGFNISEEAFDHLTDGHKHLGRVPITIRRLKKSACGL